MLHNLQVYGRYVPPLHTKQVSALLHILYSVLRSLAETTECLISFHNLPQREKTATQQSSSSNPVPNGTQKPDNLLLGYVQAAGYVALNYSFDADAASNPMDAFSKHSSWWHDKDYSHFYLDAEPDTDGLLDPYEQVGRVPFVRQPRLVVNGKVGGINDLPADGSKTVNKHNRHLLQDLIGTFGSFPYPERTLDDDNFIPGAELTDAIVPFYTTSQSILFTNLQLETGDTKTFRIAFPTPSGPPSYNYRLTGPACDQGWVSIRYTLVVGFQTGPTHDQEKAVYFPLEIKVDRETGDERWYQPNFLQKTEIKKDWLVQLHNDEDGTVPEHTPEPTSETKEAFVEDLHRLIDSDLYNMPRMSTGERKKSFHELPHDTRSDSSIAQIPLHLKTSYQIRVNSQALCTVHLSKPYYHVGDTLGFVVELEGVSKTRIGGYVAHIEAHEVFHPEDKDFTNIYRVSPPVKGNTLAAALSAFTEKCDVSGQLYFPTHLCQQFQSSSFMDLKYYVVFKFNIFELDHEVESYEDYDHYKYEIEGNETTFRLPVVLLPAV